MRCITCSNWLTMIDITDKEHLECPLCGHHQANLIAYDIHTQFASAYYQVDIDAVTPDMRKEGKFLAFNVLYGKGFSNDMD